MEGQGKSSIAPTFSKRGYNYGIAELRKDRANPIYPHYNRAIRKELHVEWSQHFSHYTCKSIGIFSQAQGQLTPQPIVESGRNLNSFEILWLSSLYARMKNLQSKTRTVRESD